MEQPSPPTSLPKYLAEGLPKQDTETLYEIQSYVESLIEYRDQSVDADELPEAAEPVDEPDSGDNGTVVKEKVTCGDDSCKCASGDPADIHGPYLYRYYRENGTMKSGTSGNQEVSSGESVDVTRRTRHGRRRLTSISGEIRFSLYAHLDNGIR